MASAGTFRRCASLALRAILLLMVVNFRPSPERMRVDSADRPAVAPCSRLSAVAPAASATTARAWRNVVSPYAFAANFVEPEETKAHRLPPVAGEVFARPKVPTGRHLPFAHAVLPPTDLVIVLRRLTI